MCLSIGAHSRCRRSKRTKCHSAPHNDTMYQHYRAHNNSRIQRQSDFDSTDYRRIVSMVRNICTRADRCRRRQNLWEAKNVSLNAFADLLRTKRLAEELPSTT